MLLYRDESTAMYLRSVILDLFGKKLYLELYCQHNKKNNNNKNNNNNNTIEVLAELTSDKSGLREGNS